MALSPFISLFLQSAARAIFSPLLSYRDLKRALKDQEEVLTIFFRLQPFTLRALRLQGHTRAARRGAHIMRGPSRRFRADSIGPHIKHQAKIAAAVSITGIAHTASLNTTRAVHNDQIKLWSHHQNSVMRYAGKMYKYNKLFGLCE